MNDSDDFASRPTAQYKYNVGEKTQTECMLEKAKRAAARHANAKEYAFFCYRCRKHGLSSVIFEENGGEGPAQFRVKCGDCCWTPKKKYASLEQVEKFQRYRTRILAPPTPPPVRPPEPPKPVIQSEAARANFEKLFGKI